MRHEDANEGPDIRGNVGRGRDSDRIGAHAEQYIVDVDYPVRKGELVERAAREGAPEDVRAFLDRLPDAEFETAGDVSRAIGELAQEPDEEE